MPGQQDECSPLRQPDHHSGQPRPTSRMDPAPPLFPSSFALHDGALALFLFDYGGIERAVALMSQLVLTANLYFLAKYREDACEAFFARGSFLPSILVFQTAWQSSWRVYGAPGRVHPPSVLLLGGQDARSGEKPCLRENTLP
jgi:hypothetical protein